MSNVVYKVVFSGKTTDGTSQESAQRRLAALFKKDPSWSAQLFSGRAITMTSTQDLKAAIKYSRILKECGAESEIVQQVVNQKNTIAPQKSNTAPAPQIQKPLNKIEQIQAAFGGEVEQLKPSLAYRFNVALVAVAMILLPLLYLSCAIGIAYGAYLFAISPEVMKMVRYASWMGLVAYGAVLASSVVVILLMFKPIFAQFSSCDYLRFPLKRKQQMPLFNLVSQIAEKVGAPTPTEIVIDERLNASARVIKQKKGAKELRLTIGLPLVMISSSNQLAGVIAHELGHFAQSSGMGLDSIINRINSWFYLSATGQDPWDYRLSQLFDRAKDETISDVEMFNSAAMIFLAVIKACLWLSRKMITLFWNLGKLVSASVSQQMEFDADQYEFHLVGSQTFKDTSLLLSVGSVAQNNATQAFRSAFYNDT